MPMRSCGVALAAALLFAPGVAGQSKRPRDLAQGKILVASRELGDPNFVRAVILLVQYKDDGVVGLVVNHPTRITVEKAFNIEAAKGRSDVIYMGGPVERTSVLALARSDSGIRGAVDIGRGIHVISTQRVLIRTLRTGIKPDSFRAYLGYAGWSRPQLQKEVQAGAWFIFPGDSSAVFDSDPGTLWNRLIERTQAQFAALSPPKPARTPASFATMRPTTPH